MGFRIKTSTWEPNQLFFPTFVRPRSITAIFMRRPKLRHHDALNLRTEHKTERRRIALIFPSLTYFRRSCRNTKPLRCQNRCKKAGREARRRYFGACILFFLAAPAPYDPGPLVFPSLHTPSFLGIALVWNLVL